MPVGARRVLVSGRGSTPGFSLTALTLARTSADSDNTLDFSAPQPADPPVGLRIELQVSTDANFTPPPTESVLDDVLADPVTLTTDAVADDEYWARARWIDASDNALSDWSNVLNFTIATTTTWNSADKAASITLSGGDLTATKASSDNTFSCVRSIGSRSTGKYYVEFTGTFSSNSTEIQVGIATSSAGVLSTYLGDTTQSLGVDYNGGAYINDALLGSGLPVSSGGVRCLAIDLDNMKVWARANGGNWNNGAIGVQNPATNTGGYSLSTLAAAPYYLAAGVYRTSNHVIVLNCGASAYAFTAPSGFGNW